MVAGLELAEQRAVHRGHAGGGGEAVLGALERGHPLLEHPHRRVAVAGVDELVGAGGDEARLGGLGVGVDEALGQEDRLGGLAVLAAARPAVHQPRPRAPVSAHRHPPVVCPPRRWPPTAGPGGLAKRRVPVNGTQRRVIAPSSCRHGELTAFS